MGFHSLDVYFSSCSLTAASALCVFVEMDLEAGDTEQVIPHLHRELQEAQELANTGKQKCLELQGTAAC